MKLAMDVASADHPLEVILEGCVSAVKKIDSVHLIAVGDGRRIEKKLAGMKYDRSRISIAHADAVITMDESPATAVKEKKNASVLIANRLVAQGNADGCWSPGNTGASLAAALLELGRLQGVFRPAIIVPIPQIQRGRNCAFLDLGANADCTADYLVQFAVMGEVIAKYAWGIENPRIALLNIGEEDSKGNMFYKEVYAKLKALPFNFIGNIEPDAIFFDRADVVVADGFTGNIALKAYEGIGKYVFRMIRDGVKRSPGAMIGALLMGGVFKDIKRKMSSDAYGGAPLIGVNGYSFIGHGSTNASGVLGAVQSIMQFITSNANMHIVDTMQRYGCAKGGAV
ncbi:MAG: phosphate acyltransferase PlsX [Spirochaetes bacterium]|nr:phosphate acyltransferase PlsX [Spirochaetota bacterium]